MPDHDVMEKHAEDCALERWGRECPDEGPPDCDCGLFCTHLARYRTNHGTQKCTRCGREEKPE